VKNEDKIKLENTSELLSRSERDKVVRKLAYIAGVEKMADNVYNDVWTTLVQLLASILWQPCNELVYMSLLKKDERKSFDVYQMRKMPPPPYEQKDESGNITIRHTLVPGMVENAASRVGLVNPKVWGEDWLVSKGSTEEEEMLAEEEKYNAKQEYDSMSTKSMSTDKESQIGEDSDSMSTEATSTANDTHYNYDNQGSFAQFDDDGSKCGVEETHA
jgi:hypothetical protein